jgi:hypothetical protein
MNAQADWWLLILGLGIGAGLTWLVLAEVRRHDDDVAATERAVEASWIADSLTASGTEADAAGIEEVLRLHRLYLASLPFDEPAWDSGAPTWAPAPALASEPATAPSAGDATPMERDRAEGQPPE